MSIEKREIIQTIDATINQYLIWKKNPPEEDSESWVIHTLLIETIFQFSPDNSSFKRNARYIVERTQENYNSLWITESQKMHRDIADLYGVLSALKSAYEQNLLMNMQQRIHADIFENFIEIAENFLQESEKLKCPAAVMLGSVLESHVRKLCEKNGVVTTIIKENKEKFRHLHDMNVDLVKKGVYNSLLQGQIDIWYKIRSEAAHGNDTAYSKQQVFEMLSGIRRFISEYPA
nr:hypothetical protein [uncultured Methanoregula sp.]